MTASLRESVKKAVAWRSGSQMLAQLATWSTTLIVIRILNPEDYGLFAMSQVVIVFLNFLAGYGFASSLVQEKNLTRDRIRQAFGLLLLVNAALALIQIFAAPLVAAYYRTPEVADLLRVQALVYLSTPFIALPEALLARNLDFRRPALANLCATAVAVIVALYCAINGYGVWTLVLAPLCAFWTRGIALMIAARFSYWPSFDMRGVGAMWNFGLMLLANQFFWTVMTQADIFIGGRILSKESLGYYAEALMLTGLIAFKFVPALNEVAFPAYASLRDDPAALRHSFLKAVRLIMLATAPLFFGIAATAPEIVAVVLGGKWLGMIPLVQVIALGMPAVTLYSLFAPVINAKGMPSINAKSSAVGACLIVPGYIVAVQFGAIGLAWVWVLGFPVLPLSAYLMSRRHLQVGDQAMLAALLPGIGAAAIMALLVVGLSDLLPIESPFLRLPILIAAGGAIYGGVLFMVARRTLLEMVSLVFRRDPTALQLPG